METSILKTATVGVLGLAFLFTAACGGTSPQAQAQDGQSQRISCAPFGSILYGERGQVCEARTQNGHTYIVCLAPKQQTCGVFMVGGER